MWTSAGPWVHLMDLNSRSASSSAPGAGWSAARAGAAASRGSASSTAYENARGEDARTKGHLLLSANGASFRPNPTRVAPGSVNQRIIGSGVPAHKADDGAPPPRLLQLGQRAGIAGITEVFPGHVQGLGQRSQQSVVGDAGVPGLPVLAGLVPAA